MEQRPRFVKPVREISLEDMPVDLKQYATIGMQYILQTDGTNSLAGTWQLDKYLVSLSRPEEVIEKGTEVIFI